MWLFRPRISRLAGVHRTWHRYENDGEGLVQGLAFAALLAWSRMSLSWCCSTRPRHKSTAGRRVALFPRSLSQRDDAQQARTKEPSRRRFGDNRTVRLDHEVGKLMETGTRRPGLVPVY